MAGRSWSGFRRSRPRGVASRSAGVNTTSRMNVRRDELIAAGVVEGTLDAAVDSADGQTIRFVEVGDGGVVLELAVLDDHIGCWPITVDG